MNLVDTSNKAAKNADLTNSLKMYQVDALDGVYGDENAMSSKQRDDNAIVQLDIEDVYLSKEKSSESAVSDSYHRVDNKWVKGNPAKLFSIFNVEYSSHSYNGYFVFYAEEHVESFTINPSAYEVKRGVSLTLSPVFSPRNAAEKGLTWVSSDTNVATVDENGVVKGLTAGTATITATSKDTTNGEIKSTATINVSADEVSNEEILFVNPPSFVSDYVVNTASLDKTDNLVTRNKLNRALGRSSSSRRSTYFENDDHTRDIYKVGARNEFKFNYSGALDIGDDLREGAAFIYNPQIDIKLYEHNGTTYSSTPVTIGGENDKIASVANNVITFNFDAFKVNDVFKEAQFKLVIDLPNSEAEDYEFEFKVFDGYNVYGLEQLVAFDDRSSPWLKENFNYYRVSNGPTYEFEDLWGEVRDPSITDVDSVHGLALHTDIRITSKDLPGSFKYTEEEVDTYIASNPSDFRSWQANRQQELDQIYGKGVYKFDGRSTLIGSLKDSTPILHRTTRRGENFTFEGNYFSLDLSDLELVYAYTRTADFDPLITSGENGGIDDGKYALKVHRASHLGFFAFNAFNMSVKSNHTEAYTDGIRGGKCYFNNFTVKGNSPVSEDLRNAGGLILFKNSATELNMRNVIASDTYTPFMSELNAYTDYDGAILLPENIRFGSINLDRCKAFSSFNPTFYAYGTTKNTIKDSILEDSGGPLILLDDVNYGDYNGNTQRRGASAVDVQNSYLENYVQGTEPWFVLYGASDMLQMPMLYGMNNNWLDRIGNLSGSKRFVTFYDNEKTVALINLVGISFTGSVNPLTYDTASETTRYLDGRITNGENNSLLDMRQIHNNSNPAISILKNLHSSAQSIIFQTNAGGVGGVNKTPDAGIIPQIYEGSTTYFPDGVKYPGQEYAVLTSDIIEGFMEEPLPLESLQAAVENSMKALGQGDYMGIYLKPKASATGGYLGLLVGLE